MDKLKRARHTVYAIRYHFVWIPKRRHKVLVGPVAQRLREILLEVTEENGWHIIELAIQPDHVHLFLEATPMEAPNQIIHAIKGVSSRVLRQEFPHLLKLPSLWTRAYFVATIGQVSSETIQRYIKAQSHAD
jgi:putative transposase